jgi:hypothetical protein
MCLPSSSKEYKRKKGQGAVPSSCVAKRNPARAQINSAQLPISSIIESQKKRALGNVRMLDVCKSCGERKEMERIKIIIAS